MKKTLLASLLALSTFASQAAIYKCTNEHGKRVYQDKPCQQQIKVRSEDEIKKMIESKSNETAKKKVAES